MQLARFAGEHRGHRLVEKRSPRGDKLYRLPERFADRPVSECIRGLSAEGWSRSEISNVTGILYQHVRNVLEGQGGGGGPKGEPGDAGGMTVEQDRVGSAVAFSSLVQHIEQGGEVTVTRDGKPVAQLISYDAAQRMAAVRRAMADMDEVRKRTSLGGLKIKDMINEGRR
jgi:antitoxin (DNA-binding transcriptional repressor) of toxin-antitoxin stability system